MVDPDKRDLELDQAYVDSQAYERVREWTRARFGLGEDNAILVAELKCSVQGCPPLETALAFWTADDTRHQFKLLKPVTEILPGDLAWLIGDLDDQETNYWDCC
jgi:nitrate reductase delta subunit